MSKYKKRIKNAELWAILVLVCLLFLIFLGIPVIRLFAKSFWTGTSVTAEYYTSVLTQQNFLRVLGNSFAVSAAAAVASVVIAFVMAYAIHHTNLPGWSKRLLQAMATLPMFLPTITYGFAIIYSFGKQGLLTKLFDRQIYNIYGFGGLLVGYVIYTIPVAFLLIHNTMGYIDKKTLIVSKTILRVVTPNAASSLIEVFSYYFISAMVTISALVFIAGARTMVLMTKIKQLQYINKYNEVFVLSLLILVTNLVAKAVFAWLARRLAENK